MRVELIRRELRFRRGGGFMTERASDARVTPLARMLVLQFERAERFSRMTFHAFRAAHRRQMIGVRGHRLDFSFGREVIKQADDGQHEQGEQEIAFWFHRRFQLDSLCLCSD